MFRIIGSWLEKVKKDGFHANHYAAAERMNHLASFDGVVNSRILHNFYRHEHAFQMKLATASGDISKASLAGTESLIQTAEYKNIKLKPLLENQLSKDIPFLTMIKTSGRYLKDDDAFEIFNSALADAKRGIMVIYSHEGSHALGFSKSENGNKLIFDPNNGEFEFNKNDFKEMINELSAISGLPMVGLQIFKAK